MTMHRTLFVRYIVQPILVVDEMLINVQKQQTFKGENVNHNFLTERSEAQNP